MYICFNNKFCKKESIICKQYQSMLKMSEILKSIITIFFAFVLSQAVNAQCSLKTSKDPCDDIVTRSAYYENVSGKPSALKLKIEQNINYKDTSTTLFILLTPSYKSCFGKESKISIQSGNDVIILPFSGQVTCKSEGEKLTDYAEMTKSNIEFLKAHTINTIRVYYINSYDDFVIKKQDYFIRTLKCFEYPL